MPNASINRAQLDWRCRRGMRELDGVLRGFLEREYDALPQSQKLAFAAVLDMPDPQVYDYLAERSLPQDRELAAIFAAIRASIRPPT